MSQSGYRRLTNAKFTSYFPLWMVRTRQVFLRLNHVLDIVFIFVGTCCSWSTTSRLPWSRASIFDLFDQSINALPWPFLSWELFYYSCDAPAFLSEACFNHRYVAVTEHHLLSCTEGSGLPKWDSCTLMSYWNVTLWHLDILTCWHPTSDSRYLWRQTVWCHESMILQNLTCNVLWPAILWLFGVRLWNLYHLLIALISKYIQNCMVLYRTVFEILTPTVWNVFIESPDICLIMFFILIISGSVTALSWWSIMDLVLEYWYVVQLNKP